ncbi:protein quiver-like [Dreissena polymorpha]|uniref:Protein quiver n=1 Tax=Dreissena polymorpha TaxID=45954 RepID=A0A9D4MUI6_DREPO|nr:protein quiver-like [Dreissena polymorpha]KAH3882475.1 hypothetical protein DPMN_006415 [Dreissena polymorpha]
MAKIIMVCCAIFAFIEVARTANVTCYTCESSKDPGCKDPFSSTNLATNSSCDACVKAKIGSVVARGCSAGGETGDRCFTILGTGTCICSTNLCNGSSHVTVTMGTIMGSALYLMSKIFY